MKPTTDDKPIKKPTAKGAVTLARRVLRYGQRIGAIAEKKRKLLERLELLEQPVEVDGDQYEVVEPKGRYVFFSKLELVKVPKNPRSPKPAAAESEVAAS